jgi:hypothetical protein
MLTISQSQNTAATRRNNTVVRLGHVINHSLFDIAEAGFAFALEILTNRATKALLYHMISVDGAQAKTSSKLPPNG